MKIIAFAASSSSKSINKKLVTYAMELLDDVEVEILDLNDFDLPLFSEDKESELGKPQLAQDFVAKIGESDGVIISFAEHNGSYAAAYKNLFDWCSRINQKVFQGKKMVMLSTSPGKGGAQTVLKTAVSSAPYFGGEVVANFSMPSFYENFDTGIGKISNNELNAQLLNAVQSLSNQKKAA